MLIIQNALYTVGHFIKAPIHMDVVLKSLALTQKCSHRCRGHSPLCSHMDGSRIHEAPSIPACSCHSGGLQHQAYKCTPRCWGYRECYLLRGQSLQGGRNKLPRRGVTEQEDCMFVSQEISFLFWHRPGST